MANNPYQQQYFYSQMQQNPQYQQYQQQFQQPQQLQPQIQNGGFVTVRSEEEARNYLVAQGTSVTFRDETAPFIYTKTRGFSPMEQPVFEKFRLVKENEPVNDFQGEAKKDIDYAEKSEIKALQSEIDDIKDIIKNLEIKKGKIIDE